MQIVSTGYEGAPGYNSFHTLGTDITDANRLVVAVGTFYNQIQSYLGPTCDYSFDGLVEDINTETGEIVGSFSQTPFVVPGEGTGDLAPAGTTYLVQWLTNTYRFGRRVRGRTFISGVLESANDNGAVSAGAQSGIAAEAATMWDDAELVIYSRPQPARLDPPRAARVGATSEVTGSSVWPKFGLMRSRRD